MSWKEFLVLTFVLRMETSTVVGCPEGCECDGAEKRLKCAETDAAVVAEYLSGNRHFRILSLIHSTVSPALWSVVCGMSSLESLDISSNRLTGFPTGCFRNMTELKSLRADNNYIMSLPDGIFDGLTSLEVVSINNNRINSIGLNVFTDARDFPSLVLVDLSSNDLREIDIWPVVLGGPRNKTIIVDLSFNSISTLTNRINFKIPIDLNKCPRYDVWIDLKSNELTYMIQFYESWAPGTSLIKARCAYTAFQDVRVERNPLACDCVDFIILTMKQKFHRMKLFEDMPCRVGTSTTSKKPAAMTCRVLEECPTGCTCFQRPYNGTLVVDCSRAKLTGFPSKLPPRKSMSYFYLDSLKYELILANSLISNLSESSTLLKYTISLDLSHGQLSFIDPGVFNLSKKIKRIFLHDNSLTTLPKEMSNFSLGVEKWSLHDNPWSCSCENEWMKVWLASIQNKLSGSVVCSTPEWHKDKDLLIVDFCYVPPFDCKLLFVIIVPTLVLLFLVAFGILLFWRRNKYLIYKKYGIRYIWETDECSKENMTHDVFLVCAEQNISLCKRILDTLEQVHGFRVLFHTRDFVIGLEIMENVHRAIDSSKRTLCLVSKDFLSSPWCVEEFALAFQNDLDRKKNRLLMALLEPVDWEAPDVPPVLKKYAGQRSFLELFKLTERRYWDVLLYSLPTPLPQMLSGDDDDVDLLTF